jgi:ATP-dependent DNA helicase RecG
MVAEKVAEKDGRNAASFDPDAPGSLRFLPGVGPARAVALAAAGFLCAADLLRTPPRLLGPPPAWCDAGPLPVGTAVRVRARVVSARPVFMRGRRGVAITALLERTDGYTLRAQFWNAGWLRRHLLPGEWYVWEGRTDPVRAGVLNHPGFVHLSGGAAMAVADEGVRTAYRAAPGVTAAVVATATRAGIARALPHWRDPLGKIADPAWRDLVLSAHQPASAELYERARRGLAERELAAWSWLLLGRRARQAAARGRAWTWSDDIDRRARARLPFALTPGQEAALAEVRADMRAPAPMCRLLHGDVGSGKTALALIACLVVIAEGGQALVLAPTALLAAQHHEFFTRCLAGSRVRIGLLTGATKAAARAELLAELAAKRMDLLVGTHALLEEEVHAPGLGLAVIDEQHRFGVAQRARLLAAGRDGAGAPLADLLLLTATPIPRTLALTLYGDLAVSRVAGRPPGRAAVVTELVVLPAEKRVLSKAKQTQEPAWMEPVVAAVRVALAAGGRAYVICPLKRPGTVEGAGASVAKTNAAEPGADSEAGTAEAEVDADSGDVSEVGPEGAVAADDADAADDDSDADPDADTIAAGAFDPYAATAVFARLSVVFPREIAVLHGDLSDAEKQAAMARFASGAVKILVATSVVEVGIDVAAANLLAVLVAERFGLAQLHQLRGRIGRGGLAGRCLLFHRGAAAPERLRALAASDDGLVIAEADLAARGPGELLGRGQHGLPALRAADLVRDLDLLAQVQAEIRPQLAAGAVFPPALRAWLPPGTGGELPAGG